MTSDPAQVDDFQGHPVLEEHQVGEPPDMTSTATTEFVADLFDVTINASDYAKRNYAEGVINLRSMEQDLPPAEFAKVRSQASCVVALLFLSTLAEHDDGRNYTDGSSVVQLCRFDSDGQMECREIDSQAESLAEVLGEAVIPDGWFLNVNEVPEVPVAEEPEPEPEQESFSLGEVAKSLNNQADFPVIDADRAQWDDGIGRQVFEDLGVITPHTPDNDFWATVPVRLSFNQAAGVVIEFGLFDLGAKEIAVLKKAIASWEESK